LIESNFSIDESDSALVLFSQREFVKEIHGNQGIANFTKQEFIYLRPMTNVILFIDVVELFRECLDLHMVGVVGRKWLLLNIDGWCLCATFGSGLRAL
jgi:hypothetical protein